jgi:hypothetical protein
MMPTTAAILAGEPLQGLQGQAKSSASTCQSTC